MKKTYITPDTELTEILHEQHLLDGSVNPTPRQDEGDPINNGLPSDIGNTTDTEDPFSDSNGNDKGQGGGGGTTRAKMWDDTWNLPQWWNF